MTRTKLPRKLKTLWNNPDFRPWIFFGMMILTAAAFQSMFYYRLWVPWFFSTLGWLLVTIASIILLGSQAFIEKAKKETGQPQLVTQGLYSYSRHPMYLNFMLAMIGFGLGSGLVWFIIIGFGAGPVFNDYVLPDEEEHLEKIFGEEWKKYKAKTPKWL